MKPKKETKDSVGVAFSGGKDFKNYTWMLSSIISFNQHCIIGFNFLFDLL